MVKLIYNIDGKFALLNGYATITVSESAVEKVFEYIKNQKQHHQKRSFQTEYEEFIKLYKSIAQEQ